MFLSLVRAPATPRPRSGTAFQPGRMIGWRLEAPRRLDPLETAAPAARPVARTILALLLLLWQLPDAPLPSAVLLRAIAARLAGDQAPGGARRRKHHLGTGERSRFLCRRRCPGPLMTGVSTRTRAVAGRRQDFPGGACGLPSEPRALTSAAARRGGRCLTRAAGGAF